MNFDIDEVAEQINQQLLPALTETIQANASTYSLDRIVIHDSPFEAGRSFDFEKLDGDYAGSLYEWIHLFCLEKTLYELFLNSSQIEEAKSVPAGMIYAPEDDDESYEEIEQVIAELHNEAIVAMALAASGCGISTNAVLSYLEESGLEHLADRISG